MERSRSYPERLYDLRTRESIETIKEYKRKDHDRAEHLAEIGSLSSLNIPERKTCCSVLIRCSNYLLERGEKEQLEDEIIRQKSYAGFYYFIKWFIRTTFILFFTTIGSVAGKEVGCEINEHSTCEINAVDLTGNSPHIVSTVFGLIFGILLGQWLGKFIWDNLTKSILKCLRRIEKFADRTKTVLLVFSLCVYAIGTVSFSVIFYFFIRIGGGDHNIIGAFVGGFTGLVCAMISYRKNSSCSSGQKTPMVTFTASSIELPELYL